MKFSITNINFVADLPIVDKSLLEGRLLLGLEFYFRKWLACITLGSTINRDNTNLAVLHELYALCGIINHEAVRNNCT